MNSKLLNLKLKDYVLFKSMDKFILELPNFIPSQLCKKIVDKFESDNNKYNGEFNYTLHNGKKVVRSKYNEEICTTNNSDWSEIDHDLHILVVHATKRYLKYITKNFDYNQKHHTLDRVISLTEFTDNGYYIQKIKKNDYYAWHVDHEIGSNLFIQIIIYLNTLDITDGGKTEFSNGRTIKPDIGKILIFPSSWTFPHHGTRVNCDAKYICTTMLKVVHPKFEE